MFSRRTFFHPDRSVKSVFGTATAMASARNPEQADGTGSLDFLVAVVDAGPVAKLLRKLNIDSESIVGRADAMRVPTPQPGLTSDAMRIVEAVTQRTLAHRRDMSSIDLFYALATTPSPARDLLLDLGLDERRLASLVE